MAKSSTPPLWVSAEAGAIKSFFASSKCVFDQDEPSVGYRGAQRWLPPIPASFFIWLMWISLGWIGARDSLEMSQSRQKAADTRRSASLVECNGGSTPPAASTIARLRATRQENSPYGSILPL